MARTKPKTKPKTKTVKTNAKKASAPKKAAAKASKPKAATPKASAKASVKKAKTKLSTKTTAKSAGAKLKGVARAAVKGLKKAAPTIAGAASLATVAATIATAASSKAKSGKTDFSQYLSPLEDRLLVLLEGASEKTAGGLFIPGTIAERPNRGRVVAVGRGVRNKKGQLRPLEVRVGETVLFAESAGSKLTLAGADLIVIRESELLGVVG